MAASIIALSSTPVMLLGTQSKTLGLNRLKDVTFEISSLSIIAAIS